jgi:hypothetical protein
MSAIRKLAVAPTDNGRRTPELAAGIAHVKIEVHRRARSEPALAQTGAIAPERAGHHDHQGAARPRHLRRAAGRAFRRREVAALTDGRCSGGFTVEARSPHGTRMRRSCRIVTRRIASAVSDRASSRALRALGAAGNGEWDARPECVSVSAGFAGQRGRCSLLSNRTGSGHEILSGNVRRLTA